MFAYKERVMRIVCVLKKDLQRHRWKDVHSERVFWKYYSVNTKYVETASDFVHERIIKPKFRIVNKILHCFLQNAEKSENTRNIHGKNLSIE